MSFRSRLTAAGHIEDWIRCAYSLSGAIDSISLYVYAPKSYGLVASCQEGPSLSSQLACLTPNDVFTDDTCSDLYTMPRFGVVPGHEHKTCKHKHTIPTNSELIALNLFSVIPYTNIFKPAGSTSTSQQRQQQEPVDADSRHLILHAKVLSLNSDFVTLDRSFPEHGLDSPRIPYRYAVYALGSNLPRPIDLWATEEATEDDEKYSEETRKEYRGTKAEGVEWLQRCQERIRKAGSVLCVGGGALGIRQSRFYLIKRILL